MITKPPAGEDCPVPPPAPMQESETCPVVSHWLVLQIAIRWRVLSAPSRVDFIDVLIQKFYQEAGSEKDTLARTTHAVLTPA